MADDAPKTTLYVAIGCAVLAVILIVVVVIVSMSGGDPTAPGAAAAAAGVAAAEATRRRINARKVLTYTRADIEETGDKIEKIKEEADADTAAVVDAVADMSDEELKNEGEALFGTAGDEENTDV